MEYGILLAESETGDYQIIGAVWSTDEARELARGYMEHGPTCGCIPPDKFFIHRRSASGFYTVIENFAL